MFIYIFVFSQTMKIKMNKDDGNVPRRINSLKVLRMHRGLSSPLSSDECFPPLQYRANWSYLNWS